MIFILFLPILGAATGFSPLHSAKFITSVPMNAPMTEEMRFQRLIKSVIVITYTIEERDEAGRS
jgi:hypothetical protein